MNQKPITLPTRVNWLRRYEMLCLKAMLILEDIYATRGHFMTRPLGCYRETRRDFITECERDIRTLLHAIAQQEKETKQYFVTLAHPLELGNGSTAKVAAVFEDSLNLNNGFLVDGIAVTGDDSTPLVLLEENTEKEPTDFVLKDIHSIGDIQCPFDIAFIYEHLYNTIDQVHFISYEMDDLPL